MTYLVEEFVSSRAEMMLHFQPKQKQALCRPAARDAQACFLDAVTHHRAGRLEDAIAIYRIATRIAPDWAEAFLGLAAVLEASGSATQAAAIRNQAARLRPGSAVNCTMLAETLLDLEETGAASTVLSLAFLYYPGDPRNLALHGRTLLRQGQYEAASGALYLSLEMYPQDATILANLALAMFHLGKPEQALEHALQALEIDGPDSSATFSAAMTLSAIMFPMVRYASALAMTDFALTLRPGHAEALSNRSLALEGLGRYDEAVEAGRHAVAAEPGNHTIRHNFATLLLGLGQLTPEAWDLYEGRLWLKGTPAWSKVRMWNGEDITGLTILLHAEQGLGDTLQFVRYAAFLAGRARCVVLAVQKPLLRLLRQVPGVDQVVAVGGVLPAFDLACPLMSLPRLLRTTMNSIPAALPYADTYDDWEDDAVGLRVGLAWAGSEEFSHDRQRSIAAAQLEALAAIPGVQFYNLQRDGREALPAALGAIDLMDGVGDFADTAALIAGLDVVVTVDTAIAHLAATMGKPVWLLSRFRGCWRWLQDRSDSPWYPSVRIIRQASPGDWDSTLEQVHHDLETLASQPPKRASTPARPRPSLPPARTCKACSTPAPALGHVDFNKSCEDRRQVALPLSGRRVTYHQCSACRLMFTGDFDQWSHTDFREHIYNEQYAAVDPDYASSRPAANAALVSALIGEARGGLRVLDYGGGGGTFAALLFSQYGMRTDTYDPFNPAHDTVPGSHYHLVTCFEVLEHTPDPRSTIRRLANLVEADGIVVFSTLLQPPDIDRHGVDWWYVAPRNGHVTLYSERSLALFWNEAGFDLVSHSDGLHVAFRTASLRPSLHRAVGLPDPPA